MSTQTTIQLIHWQNLKVLSESEVVLNLAQQKGWKDCMIFGHGDMITQPMHSHGWKLIPADLYEYSIPANGVDRLLKIIDAGVHIKGVIIADDLRRVDPPQVPANPKMALPSTENVFSIIGKALVGLIIVCGVVFLAACAVFMAPLFILSTILDPSQNYGVDYDYDPQLIILVDDGTNATAWISVLTWYD